MVEARRKARIEIARLLFEDWRGYAVALARDVDFPQRRSVTGLKSAVKLLSGDDPIRHARFVSHVRQRRLRRCDDSIQDQIDATLAWLVDRIPFALVAPQRILAEGHWLEDGLDDLADLAPETLDLADLILAEAQLAGVGDPVDNDDEFAADGGPFADAYALDDAAAHGGDDERWTDGRRAVQLTPEMSGTSSRFSTLGIDQGVATFAENGPSDGGFGSRTYQRWRTRERRPRVLAVTSLDEAARLLGERTGTGMDELRTLMVRGRPTHASKPAHDRLDAAIDALRTGSPKVRVGALAAALDCDPATVWRRARAGRQINARFSVPIGEEN